MLDVLKNLKYHGGGEGLLFFLCDVISNGQIKVQDAEVICSHAPGKRHLSVGELVAYCHALGWIQVTDSVITTSTIIAPLLGDKEKLNDTLIVSTVNQLFEARIIESNMFYYDVIQRCYAFKNELLPLSLSSVRNVLISQGFFVPIRDCQGTRLYIASTYDELVAGYCRKRRKQHSLEQLKKQLESNELAGERAELFALEYERARVGHPLCEQVRRISEIDVAAGYDIVSFDSNRSTVPDRFIEVKAASRAGFYWSKNEYEIAKLKGEAYYLYLVELSRVDEPDYSPEIIQNPAANIMGADRWFVEAQSYYIKRV